MENNNSASNPRRDREQARDVTEMFTNKPRKPRKDSGGTIQELIEPSGNIQARESFPVVFTHNSEGGIGQPLDQVKSRATT
jgi:hypothetical protein